MPCGCKAHDAGLAATPIDGADALYACVCDCFCNYLEGAMVRGKNDRLPHALDGLTRVQRVVLHELQKAQQERPGRGVSSVMLYGRVVESIDVSEAEFQVIVQSLQSNHAPLCQLSDN